MSKSRMMLLNIPSVLTRAIGTNTHPTQYESKTFHEINLNGKEKETKEKSIKVK